MNDPSSTVVVLAMWGTQSYFDAHGTAWMFNGLLEVPPRTAEDCDILQMAREAFNAAAGLPDARPRGLKFLAVHCDIAELMSADDASGVRIGVRGFLQASLSKSHKWETWLQHSWDWRPLRGGLGGNEDFENASIEVKAASSGWVELIVDGTLGKNNALRTAVPQQARAARSSGCALRPFFRSRIEYAYSLEIPSFRQARAACVSSAPRTHRLDAAAAPQKLPVYPWNSAAECR